LGVTEWVGMFSSSERSWRRRIRVIVAAAPSPLRTRASAYLAGDADIHVAAIGTSAGAVKACVSRPPDVVLVAQDLASGGALAAVERITAVAFSVRILLWSDAPDGPAAIAAIKRGARGVIDQRRTRNGLIRCEAGRSGTDFATKAPQRGTA
jgi:DNA-binding NarL/FixJ family response regulator